MDECYYCGGTFFGFHACATIDLIQVIVAKDKKIASLKTKLRKAKKK